MTLGEKLRQARLHKGLSQNQVVGDQMTRNMLSQLENDLASPSVKTLQYLAKVLEVPIGWLLDESQSADRETVIRQAKDLYRTGRFFDCVDLLQRSDLPMDDEIGLLLYRSTLYCAEKLLKEKRTAQAESVLQTAERVTGLYIGPAERRDRLMLKLRCTMQAGRTDDALAQAVSETSTDKELRTLLAQHDLEKGKELTELGSFDEALPYLHRAEASAALLKDGEKRRMYRLLEQCFLAQEDYKAAYRYASLRNPPD